MLYRDSFFILGVLMFRLSSEYCKLRDNITATEGEHFYLKYCPVSTEHKDNMTTVQWYKEDVQLNSSSSSRITFSGYSLEFWPIELDDSGNYELHIGKHTHRWKVNVNRKSVNSCFSGGAVRSWPVEFNTTFKIDCEDDYYEKIANKTLLYKNCEKTENSKNPPRILKNAEFKDQGYYTCVFVIPHNGKLFHATSTFNITITKANRIVNPVFHGPNIEHIQVELGKDVLLNCSASLNKENQIYFEKTELPNVYEDAPSLTRDEEGKWQASSTLRIKNINKRNLNITYICFLIKTGDIDIKTFILVEKEMDDIQSHIFTRGMIAMILISVVVVCLVILGVIYRIDLALFCRYLMRRDEALTGSRCHAGISLVS